LLGLVVAGVFLRDKTLVRRMRSIAFAVFTPFYFIKAGLYVSLPALWTSLLVIGVFLALKMVTKIAGVFPLARRNQMSVKEASYTTLLMATGLTFGTISSLYGLQNGIINQNQYTVLVSVVILSAFVPTLIAQKFFQPTVEMMQAWGQIYRRRLGTLSVEDIDGEEQSQPQARHAIQQAETGAQNPPSGLCSRRKWCRRAVGGVLTLHPRRERIWLWERCYRKRSHPSNTL